MALFLTGIKMRPRWAGLCVLAGLVLQTPAAVTATILAGGETDLPADTLSGRLDTEGIFSFVGALAISSGGGNYKGSAVALSREWVLTAAHNVDLNDDGLPDAVWSGVFHLPGHGSFGVTQAFTHPGFSGFGNPSVNDDLALLQLATPLPVGMGSPTLGSGAGIGGFIIAGRLRALRLRELWIYLKCESDRPEVWLECDRWFPAG